MKLELLILFANPPRATDGPPRAASVAKRGGIDQRPRILLHAEFTHDAIPSWRRFSRASIDVSLSVDRHQW